MDVKPRTALGTIGVGNSVRDRHAPVGNVSQMFSLSRVINFIVEVYVIYSSFCMPA